MSTLLLRIIMFVSGAALGAIIATQMPWQATIAAFVAYFGVLISSNVITARIFTEGRTQKAVR